jgi:hypothetical protein
LGVDKPELKKAVPPGPQGRTSRQGSRRREGHGALPPHRRVWKAIVADVQLGRSLDAKDLALLAKESRNADTLDTLEKAIKRDGATVETSQGRSGSWLDPEAVAVSRPSP